MKSMINSVSRTMWNPSLGLLIIRIGTGLVFLMHGWSKYGNMEGVNAMFMGMGFPAGTATFVMGLEIIGGIALILGVLPRVFAVLFAILMAVAIVKRGFFSGGYQPHELELLLLLLSLGITFTGSGRYAIWKSECDECGGMVCDVHKQ